MGKLVVLILFSLYQCFGAIQDERSSPWIPISDTLIHEVGEKFAEEYGLIFIGSGGAMFDCIHTMELSFQLCKPIDQDQGRVLIVELVHAFLDEINSNKKIQPYLDRQPATLDNVRLTVFILENNGHPTSFPYLGVVSNVGERIFYDYRNSEGEYGYKEIKEENYLEALQIIQEQINCGTYRPFQKAGGRSKVSGNQKLEKLAPTAATTSAS